ncbi:LOW QUALITY PROTEIN: p21-activated protein kinase-interacting protein 1-like [Sarcophilus harrisii]
MAVNNQFVVTGGKDEIIHTCNMKKKNCLKSIKTQKRLVTSLSVHPSGKLVLSVGTDKTLQTWNLIEGRSTFIKTNKNVHIFEWSPCMYVVEYVVVIINKIDIYQLETASITGTITAGKRISSVTFISDSILVAKDEEIIRLFDCDSIKCLCEFKAHQNSIKVTCVFEVPEYHVIVIVSSDGFIKMWKHNPSKKIFPSLLCEVNTKARHT